MESDFEPQGPQAAALNDWPLRPWILASLLAVAGFMIFAVTRGDGAGDDPTKMALAAFALFGGLAAAFAMDEGRELRAALFGFVAGLVMAGIAYRAVSAGDNTADAPFWVAAGILALGLALPLFQAGFLRDRWRTSYEAMHFHVWTDALSAAGAFAFTGLSWLLLVLLAALFRAIDIDILDDLMHEPAFGWMFSGAAFGGALGVLRNQRRVLGTVQHVAMLVLSILAVPFAAALTLFLIALVVSGPQVLWNATTSATPLLLACAAASFVLANAILRDDDRAMTGNAVLRWSARVLAALILPLTVFAAVSIGLRIGQHGLSPERIWALLTVAVATAYGLAYAVSLVRGWKSGTWRDTLRQANLHLAVGTSALALLLALPILDFGAISTRDQLARLESGAVSAEEFDYAALKWEFGDAGRAALARLARSEDTAIATRAGNAQAVANRYDVELEPVRPDRYGEVGFAFEDTALREAVHGYLANNPWQCEQGCVALDAGERDGRRMVVLTEGYSARQIYFRPSDLVPFPPDPPAAPPSGEDGSLEVEAVDPASAEIREVTGRRVYVDGKPVGDIFE
ncbi:DUF4153 domain-containing protein [Alteriqipengyuania flavescens]|uniref:DUF4153 domain-containing protein n=1 Tax=Alteriqipengyuania flavescens TaxID=3053610 RepID=UPI0025B4A90A|nr:DUF4153 domain-containing protein [Alteriqipengyuania flavescens]WJY19141.1 DUF4153 domain-containing protein [Alteriqipengyuania flavescens]WJY25081.1 DUF4153 domain-containing protein [Alteriqipengyuania flavescens]